MLRNSNMLPTASTTTGSDKLARRSNAMRRRIQNLKYRTARKIFLICRDLKSNSFARDSSTDKNNSPIGKPSHAVSARNNAFDSYIFVTHPLAP
jgi:hypothetical protein